ncbi:hypothetical protein A1O7_03678 [Cladophialophora yegresii CBS 114405]|uniref:Uncharacterized protein n=1 Tax=Cladophialophora yegresii CBS 114405 TaxID=1182544 RepID=W9WF80_9EURO|nr:uncharacterized protein A1O7_03678 [Cladophialophora yegresii CBS 114405]EXJ63231.1 hypothetical protein A1O7_03678 [Cladophialophora yegresii CBS 114405]
MYTQSIVAGLLSIAALTTAAPLTARTESGTYASNNGTLITTSSTLTMGVTSSASTSPVSSTPAPAPSSNTGAQPVASILPDFTSQYTASTGAIDFHTSRGLVSRLPQDGGKDITTLVTFELPTQYADHECQLIFDQGNDPSGYVTGTGKAQLFTSLASADEDSATWPSGNLRNQNLGTIQLSATGRAVWEAGSGPGATVEGKFPCSNIAGKVYGGEIVPVGDADTISWIVGRGDGPKILVW